MIESIMGVVYLTKIGGLFAKMINTKLKQNLKVQKLGNKCFFYHYSF